MPGSLPNFEPAPVPQPEQADNKDMGWPCDPSQGIMECDKLRSENSALSAKLADAGTELLNTACSLDMQVAMRKDAEAREQKLEGRVRELETELAESTENYREHIRKIGAERDAAQARVRELEACFPPPLSHGQTLAKRALLAGQIKKIRQAQVCTLPCAGCGRTISLTVARKCHWCGCWYCRECSDVHFGTNPDKVRAAALAAAEVPA